MTETVLTKTFGQHGLKKCVLWRTVAYCCMLLRAVACCCVLLHTADSFA